MEVSQEANHLWDILSGEWQQTESKWKDQAKDEFARRHLESLDGLAREFSQVLSELDDLLKESRWVNDHL